MKGTKDKVENSDEELEPFAPHISNTLFPYGLKIPHVAPFDGNSDPYNHSSTFNTIMRASNVSNKLRCMLFPTGLINSEDILSHLGINWKRNLKNNSRPW